MKHITVLTVNLLFLVMFSHNSYGDQTQQTADYFRSIQHSPARLRMFLAHMPKGGDLHSHLDGSVYAETLLRLPKSQNLCFGGDSYKVYNNHCEQQKQLKQVIQDPQSYDQVIDQWSMRHFPLQWKSGQQHFFSSFNNIEAAVNVNTADIIRTVSNRAARQNEQYLELMIGDSQLANNDGNAQTPDKIGKQVTEQQSLGEWRDQLLTNGLHKITNQLHRSVESLTYKARAKQHCRSDGSEIGCGITLRYQYFINRNLPLDAFYAQLVTGFELAAQNKQVVGINIVGPENWPNALKNYDRQMHMIGYLRSLYPNVHVALHAGELKLGQVSPKNLQDHVHKAVTIAHAERIGHGVDIAYEQNCAKLLAYMRDHGIDVETNLTSNWQVLGLTKNDHPWSLYHQTGVPTTISTDDAGIERIDLTHEYQKMVTAYDLNYYQLKSLIRNNLTYSFLPGESLWLDQDYSQLAKPCRKQTLGADQVTQWCQTFLAHNQKAQEQWRLEKAFRHFEATMAGQ